MTVRGWNVLGMAVNKEGYSEVSKQGTETQLMRKDHRSLREARRPKYQDTQRNKKDALREGRGGAVVGKKTAVEKGTTRVMLRVATAPQLCFMSNGKQIWGFKKVVALSGLDLGWS